MPGIAVVIAVLTAVFSLTLLLLLYVKHYTQRNAVVYVNHPQRFAISRYDYTGGVREGGRKNSGIDRSVIESLPVFRFGALSGHKDGLECAVCLSRFEPSEVLRLLPKCKHAFHVECVDTWLDAHSTCPLCRYRVDPEDILLISDCNSWFELRLDESKPSNRSNTNNNRSIPGSNRFEYVSRISGRHSSAGERKSRLSKPETVSFRRSLDSKNVTVLDRKDGMLLMMNRNKERFEHRIMISGNGGDEERWSEVRASDLLYLRSEMMVISGRDVINEGRSVSELTSVERRRRWGGESRQRQVKEVISRWLDWSQRRGGGGGSGSDVV